MTPMTKFKWIDQSAITPIPVEDPIYKPLLLMGISSDKGPEEYTMNEKEEFFERYGNDISFTRHGQPLLQAANAINAGAKLFVKRIVAPDSALANLGVTATLKATTVQKTDAEGNLLYLDSITQKETIVSTDNIPVMVEKINVSYATATIPQAKKDADGNLVVNTLSSIASEIYAQATFNEDTASETSEDGIVYPLFVIADNGRGVSKKKFKITTDFATAKANSHMRYNFEILESNASSEVLSFAMHPDARYLDNNISLKPMIDNYSRQVRCKTFDDAIYALYNKLAVLLGEDPDVFAGSDILFGSSKKGIKYPNLVIGGTSLANAYGLPLESGSNGSFGEAPISSVDYNTEMVKVFTGEFSNDIFDLDNYKFDAIVDANYAGPVKRAIENLVTFREDCFYFRDLGLGLKNVSEILAADKESLKNFFCASYHNSYDITDPYSKKQISVTITYDLVSRLVRHFANGRTRPLAGQLHGITFPNAIEGTINFIPKMIPSVDQKEILDDARINYASYYDGLLVMETLYTSQEDYSQLSFLNNVLAAQEVIKAVRSRCPKIRYSFIDGNDLEKYKADVQNVINKFINNFASIKLEYITDSTMIANKVFYAALKISFRDFVQSEYFKLIALPSGVTA